MDHPLRIDITTSIPPSIHAEYQTIKDLSYVWLKSMTAADRKKHSDQFCSQKDLISHVLAYRNQLFAGACMLFSRKVFGDRPLLLGGIGGLFVKKEWQHQGIATAIIKKAIDQLIKEGCDLAYLCTDVDHLGSLYEPFGFTPLKQGHTYLGKSGNRYTEYDGMLAPVKSRRLFRQIIDNPIPFDIGLGNW